LQPRGSIRAPSFVVRSENAAGRSDPSSRNIWWVCGLLSAHLVARGCDRRDGACLEHEPRVGPRRARRGRRTGTLPSGRSRAGIATSCRGIARLRPRVRGRLARRLRRRRRGSRARSGLGSRSGWTRAERSRSASVASIPVVAVGDLVGRRRTPRSGRAAKRSKRVGSVLPRYVLSSDDAALRAIQRPGVRP
jgi:hypothetical protein